MYLKPLDDAMDQAGLCYVRYMDDWVVLSKTCWQLHRAMALVNRTLAALKREKHPDKTWVGRIDRGEDFVGYRHTRAFSGTTTPASRARCAGLPNNLVLFIPTVSSAERDRSWHVIRVCGANLSQQAAHERLSVGATAENNIGGTR
ncbi:MAG: hypothetical protein ACJARN_001590 [Arenicella sp.]